MTEQEWDANQSAAEVIRKLIEEGSEWNEMMVFLNWRVLLNASIILLIYYVVYVFELASFLWSGSLIQLLMFVVLTPWAIYAPFFWRGGYRYYRKNVARRKVWRSRFQILREKERELDRLLSGEGAD